MEKKTWETPTIKQEDLAATASALISHSAEHDAYYLTTSG